MTLTAYAARCLVTCAFALGATFATSQTPDTAWPTYGGDAGGQRYSTAAQITRTNVHGLRTAWTYHTHALRSSNHSVASSAFEATPILFRDTLYLTTPFDRIIALDPASGAERWTYDPHIADDILASNYTSRGVAAWQDSSGGVAMCQGRIFVATLDARLIAVDASSGKPCADFGKNGAVDLKTGVPTPKERPYHYFGNTSPPTVVGDIVVAGSAIVDNESVEPEPGYVRGYDVRTGRLVWTWEALPKAAGVRTGAGNAWSVIAADVENQLLFVPTGSAAPDFYGGLRSGDNRDANSLVALDARTGKKVWAFQLVHHDVWDYDVAAEPLLFLYQGRTPAVAVAAKPGILFVFNRLTGEPLFPITERRVPATDVPGETLSPTQPFSSLPSLTPERLDLSKLNATCSDRLRGLRYEGIYTPPSLPGTLQFPGSLGGVNWGSMSFDPETGMLYANTNRSAYEIRLTPQPSLFVVLLAQPESWYAVSAALFAWFCVRLLRKPRARRRRLSGAAFCVTAIAFLGVGLVLNNLDVLTRSRNHNFVNSPDSVGEVSANRGAPYRIYRRVLQDDQGRPCTPQPWGATVALNLNTGKLGWEKPLGTLIPGEHTGTVNFGAPIVTGGGLLFTAASSEPLLRAIDKATGEEVFAAPLPVPAQSTPMTYVFRGRQYVVVAAGGHGGLGTPLGDSVVAFALP